MGRRSRSDFLRLIRVIEAVLFDFGGVILSSPFEAFAAYEREHGLPDGFLRAAQRHRTPTPTRGRGSSAARSTLDEFCDAVRGRGRRRSATTIDGARVLALLAGEVRPEMVEAVRRCSRAADDRRCLTNNFVAADAGHVDREPQMAEVMALFDVVIESSKVGVRKPDPRFYEMACELLDVEPDRGACSSTTSASTSSRPRRWA